MSKEYKKGQKVNVPRVVVPYLESLIKLREQYQAEAFQEIAKAFGFGSEDIGPDQNWGLRIDRDNWECWLHDRSKDSEEPMEGTEKKSLDTVLGAVCKLEIQGKLQPLVVYLIEYTMKDMDDYRWSLNPETMKLEITGKKEMPVENIFEALEAEGVEGLEGLKPVGDEQ